MPEITLTARQVATIQTELRAALGLPPDEFPISVFVSMISDEIEQLRARGFTDGDIAKMIRDRCPATVSAEDIRRYYAQPEARRRPAID